MGRECRRIEKKEEEEGEVGGVGRKIRVVELVHKGMGIVRAEGRLGSDALDSTEGSPVQDHSWDKP